MKNTEDPVPAADVDPDRKKMIKVPNPAAAKGASRTRDSFRQPMVGDDADWSQRTNLTSIQGNSGRVMPAASQMNKAAGSKVAGFNPVQVATRAKALATGAAPVAKRFAGMDPMKARSARLESFQKNMASKTQSPSVGVSVDALRNQGAAAPAANRALVGANVVPAPQVRQAAQQMPKFQKRQVLQASQQPTATGMRAGTIRSQFPQAVPQAPAVQAPVPAAKAQAFAQLQNAPTAGMHQYVPHPQGHMPSNLGKGTFVTPNNPAPPGAAEAERAAKTLKQRAAKPPPQQQALGKHAMIDTSGQEPKLVFEKKASANTALGGKYPLDSYADIRAAVDYFGTNWAEFDPVERHIYCVKTASAAESIGLEVPEMMARYGSLMYADDITAHIASRKANLEKDAHPMYDALMEKKAELHPEEFADLLAKADIATGLNWHWGGPVADPWYATFGGQPKEEFFKVANSEISESQLQAIAESGALEGVFEKDLVDGFKKDPGAIFQSLPDDAKQIIANLAG